MIDRVSFEIAKPSETARNGPVEVARQPNGAASEDFASALVDLARNTSQSVANAEAAAISGVNGQMPVQKVVETVMQAEQSLQAAIAVRDKVVAAYLEISRMQI